MPGTQRASVRLAIKGLSLSAMLAFFASAVLAQTPQWPETGARFEGTFQAEDSRAEARALADEAIDEVVDEMFFLTRAFARQQLQDSTRPCQEVWFEFAGGQVTVGCDDRKPTRSPIDGTQVTFENEEGEVYELVQGLENGRVVQEFGDERGVRRNEYTLSPDGQRLRLDVTVSSPRLPRPVTYSRFFRLI